MLGDLVIDRSKALTMFDRIADWFWPILVMACAVLVWDQYAVWGHLPSDILPRPWAVAKATIANKETLLSNAGVTLVEIVLGFVVSAIGIPAAILIDRFKWLEGVLYPYLIATQVVPMIAVAPLIVLWMGYGLLPKVFIVAIFGIFATTIQTLSGLQSIELEKYYLARSMSASFLGFYWQVKLPQALPHIFQGLKLSATLSVIGAIVAEFVASRQGLGHYIVVASANFDAVALFSAVIYLAFIGIAFFALVVGAERLAIPWHVSQRRTSV